MRVVRDVDAGEGRVAEEARRGEVSPGGCNDAGVICVHLEARCFRRDGRDITITARILEESQGEYSQNAPLTCGFRSVSHPPTVVLSVRRERLRAVLG